MAIPKRQITGSILRPTAVGVRGGTIEITLSAPGSVTDDVSGDKHRVGGSETVEIDEAGAVSFELIPNDVLDPAGTHYRARRTLANGCTRDEFWTIPSGASALSLGDIPQVEGSTPAPGFLQVTAVGALPTPSAQWAGKIAWLSLDGAADEAHLCMQARDGSWEWCELAMASP